MMFGSWLPSAWLIRQHTELSGVGTLVALKCTCEWVRASHMLNLVKKLKRKRPTVPLRMAYVILLLFTPSQHSLYQHVTITIQTCAVHHLGVPWSKNLQEKPRQFHGRSLCKPPSNWAIFGPWGNTQDNIMDNPRQTMQGDDRHFLFHEQEKS